jgi:superfamily II helicase
VEATSSKWTGLRPAALIGERRSSASYEITDPHKLALILATRGFHSEPCHSENELFRMRRAHDRRLIVIYKRTALCQGVDVPGSRRLLEQLGGAS